MKGYVKPVAMVSSALSEGVFAASGAQSASASLKLESQNIWNDSNGQNVYTLTLDDSVKGTSAELHLIFNAQLENAWGDYLKMSVNGSNLIIKPNWPEKYEQSSYSFTIQSQKAKTLELKSISVDKN